MSIQSPVSIVWENSAPGHTPVELVGVGGWLRRLPDFLANQNVHEADGIFRSAAFFKPMGAVSVSFDLEVEVDLPSTGAALHGFLDSAIADAPREFPALLVVTWNVGSAPYVTEIPFIEMSGGKPSFYFEGPEMEASVNWSESMQAWGVYDLTREFNWYSGEPVASPDLVVEWVPLYDGGDGLPTVSRGVSPVMVSGTGTLTITVPGEDPIVFPDAAVSDLTPDLPSGDAATLVRTYSIQTTLPI